MAYAVILKRSAEKELDRLSEAVHRRIVGKLLKLENYPRPPGVQKLHGHVRLSHPDWRLPGLVPD